MFIVLSWFFVFQQYQFLFSSFISFFMCVLFLVNLARGFVYPLEKTALDLLISQLPFNLNFISSLIFIISFLLTLGFVYCCCFLIILSGRLGCLFEIFILFWGRLIQAFRFEIFHGNSGTKTIRTYIMWFCHSLSQSVKGQFLLSSAFRWLIT